MHELQTQAAPNHAGKAAPNGAPEDALLTRIRRGMTTHADGGEFVLLLARREARGFHEGVEWEAEMHRNAGGWAAFVAVAMGSVGFLLGWLL